MTRAMTDPWVRSREGAYVYVRELEWTDLDSLVAIEAASHPPEIRDGREMFDTMLGSAWDTWPLPLGRGVPGRRPIRLGLVQNERLTGYLLARSCEADGRPFVHIDDLALLPETRRHLARLIDGFVRQYLRFRDAGAPIIAHGFETEMTLWKRHRRLFRHLGAELSEPELVDRTGDGEPVYRVRWEPRPDARWMERGSAADGGARRVGPEPVGAFTRGGIEFEAAVARTVGAWSALEQEWRGLAARVPELTAFETFDFLRLWWDQYGISSRPQVLTLRREGVLAAIAPLAIYPEEFGGRTVRELGFMGSRWEADRPRLLVADDPFAAGQALAAALVELREEWDVLYLYEQAPDSPALLGLVAGLESEGYLIGRGPDSVCPFIDTRGDWAEFLGGHSSNFRKNLRRARRKLEEHGALAYRVMTSPDEMDEAFRRYLDVETRSWKADTTIGLHSDAIARSFYGELAEHLAPEGAFQFRFLEVDGRPAAGTFGIVHDRRFYSLKIAHDAECAPASPGTLLESHELRDCFEGPIDEYDFLGGFLTNKSRWTDRVRSTVQLFAFPPTLRWRLFHLDRFVLRPWVKTILRRHGWLDRALALRDRLRGETGSEEEP